MFGSGFARIIVSLCVLPLTFFGLGTSMETSKTSSGSFGSPLGSRVSLKTLNASIVCSSMLTPSSGAIRR